MFAIELLLLSFSASFTAGLLGKVDLTSFQKSNRYQLSPDNWSQKGACPMPSRGDILCNCSSI